MAATSPFASFAIPSDPALQDTATITFHRGCESIADINDYLARFAEMLNDERFERSPVWLVFDGSALGLGDLVSFTGDFQEAHLAFQEAYRELFDRCTRGACVVRPNIFLAAQICSILSKVVPARKPFAFVGAPSEVAAKLNELKTASN